MSDAYNIDVYHTGNYTSWCFEVRLDGVLIGASYSNHHLKDACEKDAKKFVEYYIPRS